MRIPDAWRPFVQTVLLLKTLLLLPVRTANATATTVWRWVGPLQGNDTPVDSEDDEAAAAHLAR